MYNFIYYHICNVYDRLKCLDDITDSVDASLNKLWKIMKDREAWGAAVRRFAESDMTEQ